MFKKNNIKFQQFNMTKVLIVCECAFTVTYYIFKKNIQWCSSLFPEKWSGKEEKNLSVRLWGLFDTFVSLDQPV